MLIIGSLALREQIPTHMLPSVRVPTDIDIIGTEAELTALMESSEVHSEYANKVVLRQGSRMIEFEVARAGNNQEHLLEILQVPEFESVYARLDVLYALKMSHRFLKNSPHFLKTMKDIHFMRHLLGIHREHLYNICLPDETISGKLKDWYKQRVEETYTYSHPKLNQSKEAFFDPSEFTHNPYVYDHDSIHEAVKIGDKPAYEAFGDGPVMVSMVKFLKAPFQVQINSVYEESAVLALERSIIPFGTQEEDAFRMALKKVCTSIASGHWRAFAWENYYRVMGLYLSKQDLCEKLEAGLANGIIKPFRGD